MELTTTSSTEEPLFSRTHLILEATFEASVPARGVIAQRLSDEHGVPLERIVIRTISPRFGSSTAVVDAYVYADEAKLREIEGEHLVTRTKKTLPKEEQAAEESADA